MLLNKWRQALKKSGAVLLATALLSACGGGKAVAVYTNTPGGEEGTVTQEELDTFIGINKFLNPSLALYEEQPAFQQDMLMQYVGFRVLGSRLDEEGTKEAEAEAEEQLAAFKEALGDRLEEELNNADLEMGDLENYVKLYSRATAQLEKQVTEEELRQLYDDTLAANPDAFTTATVSHILIALEPEGEEVTRTKEEALDIAEEVRDKLLGGADFAEMAAEYSDDPGSKDTGGTYADVNVNNWFEGFKKAVLELPLNEISEPVETEYGYHIVKVSERNAQTFEEAEPTLRARQVVSEFMEFLDTEVPGLIVENNLPEEDSAKDGQTGGNTGGNGAADGEDGGDQAGGTGETGDASENGGEAGADDANP